MREVQDGTKKNNNQRIDIYCASVWHIRFCDFQSVWLN